MSNGLNDTHDPQLTSWVESANDPKTDFPIQNLPFGVFKQKGADDDPRIGVAIGDQILDIVPCRQLFTRETFMAAIACEIAALNALMALDKENVSAFRARISEVLRKDADKNARAVVERSLIPMTACEILLAAEIGDYTDFYASIFHATNVGSMFRPDNPLLPNYKHIPVAYHGRASSVRVSKTAVRRPMGQTKTDDADAPTFGPSKLLDYELEVGFFVGRGNVREQRVSITNAEDHIFGVCLVNDWSARDIQKWEYQPLGPFLAKSFATTVSPWIVTLEALEPFRVPAFQRPKGDPKPLEHLDSPENRERGGLDLTLEVWISSEKMRDENLEPTRVSVGHFTDMYWTIAQMLAHHTSNGCNLRSGDLLASGTVSGKAEDSRGCLLELTWRGQNPIELPTGEERRFLQDGDEVIMRGYCEKEGYRRIGLGECRGVVLPAGG